MRAKFLSAKSISVFLAASVFATGARASLVLESELGDFSRDTFAPTQLGAGVDDVIGGLSSPAQDGDDVVTFKNVAPGDVKFLVSIDPAVGQSNAFAVIFAAAAGNSVATFADFSASLTLTSFSAQNSSFTLPGFPGGDLTVLAGILSETTGNYRITIEAKDPGQVPIPGAAIVFMSGIAGFAAARGSRRRRG